MIERLKRMWRELDRITEEPFPDYAICNKCSGVYTDYNKHIKYCRL